MMSQWQSACFGGLARTWCRQSATESHPPYSHKSASSTSNVAPHHFQIVRTSQTPSPAPRHGLHLSVWRLCALPACGLICSTQSHLHDSRQVEQLPCACTGLFISNSHLATMSLFEHFSAVESGPSPAFAERANCLISIDLLPTKLPSWGYWWYALGKGLCWGRRRRRRPNNRACHMLASRSVHIALAYRTSINFRFGSGPT
ncbi:uncharacterized protein BKA78DRAFT_10517 [Phyllosticta capitalensis]|uniref:Uncharacterized protein n=1 Tax=Phyllosticta capitalensis TaxID=121624 RepID=A0ABR1Z2U0_9PEZI